MSGIETEYGYKKDSMEIRSLKENIKLTTNKLTLRELNNRKHDLMINFFELYFNIAINVFIKIASTLFISWYVYEIIIKFEPIKKIINAMILDSNWQSKVVYATLIISIVGFISSIFISNAKKKYNENEVEKDNN
jgi:hypothetical protein